MNSLEPIDSFAAIVRLPQGAVACSYQKQSTRRYVQIGDQRLEVHSTAFAWAQEPADWPTVTIEVNGKPKQKMMLLQDVKKIELLILKTDFTAGLRPCKKSEGCKLSLPPCGLTSVPDAIVKVTDLRKLHLPRNDIAKLPEGFGQLTNLKVLDLEGNDLAEFPPAITELTELEQLNLARNRINVLPQTIGALRNLWHLNLESNWIESLPKAVGELTELNYLNLAGNRLSTVTVLMRLKDLGTLLLGSNRLRQVPSGIVSLEDLECLDLSGNPLSSFPTVVTRMSKLWELHLANTGIDSVPSAIGSMKALNTLVLRGNQNLTALPLSVAELASLVELDIRCTQVPQGHAEAMMAVCCAQDKGLSTLLSARLSLLAQLTGKDAAQFSFVYNWTTPKQETLSHWLGRIAHIQPCLGEQTNVVNTVFHMVLMLRYSAFHDYFFWRVSSSHETEQRTVELFFNLHEHMRTELTNMLAPVAVTGKRARS